MKSLGEVLSYLFSGISECLKLYKFYHQKNRDASEFAENCYKRVLQFSSQAEEKPFGMAKRLLDMNFDYFIEKTCPKRISRYTLDTVISLIGALIVLIESLLVAAINIFVNEVHSVQDSIMMPALIVMISFFSISAFMTLYGFWRYLKSSIWAVVRLNQLKKVGNNSDAPRCMCSDLSRLITKYKKPFCFVEASDGQCLTLSDSYRFPSACLITFNAKEKSVSKSSRLGVSQQQDQSLPNIDIHNLELPKDYLYVVLSLDGIHSYILCRSLQQAGYDVVDLGPYYNYEQSIRKELYRMELLSGQGFIPEKFVKL